MDWKFNNQLLVELSAITSAMGSRLTDEQKEFVSDFTTDTLSFSDAGTGKTYSLIAGIALAQAYYKIKGSEICCISYTNAAVNEISARYSKLYKKMTLGSKPDFRTFHSLNLRILNDAYPGITTGNITFADVKSMMDSYMHERGLSTLDGTYTKKVYNAINSLNSALVFSEESLMQNYKFLELEMSIDNFNYIRRRLFSAGIIRKKIDKGDIPIYCLYALHKYPQIIEKWKGKFKVMVVDEFQDLTLLHLEILNYITQTLIAIGDMKQQIYGFNGASDLIVDKYLEHRPNARRCNLTQSFRCANEIADFAKSIVESNVIDGTPINFKGNGPGGIVEILKSSDMNWNEVANSISRDIKEHSYVGAKDVMFLYRNNAAMIPIVEELYQLGIQFRCANNRGYTTIMDLPLVGDLFSLAYVALNDSNPEYLNKALRLFPEFNEYGYGTELPPVTAVRKFGKGLLSMNYKWKESSSKAIINAILNAKVAISNGEKCGRVLNTLWAAYSSFIISKRWWLFDNIPEYYFGLVGDILVKKTIEQVIKDEEKKLALNDNNIRAGIGVRCYTLHSAKGLEADEVYILDANEGLFPNAKILKNKTEKGCILDAAKDIRNERNLLFVGATRAKKKLVITYTGELAKLISKDSSKYKLYDDEYIVNSRNVLGDDVGSFYNLFNIGDSGND